MASRLQVEQRQIERTSRDFRRVTEITYNGQCLNVPDDAIDVTVQPLAQYGVIRVTYLQPLQPVKFDDGHNEQTYIY